MILSFPTRCSLIGLTCLALFNLGCGNNDKSNVVVPEPRTIDTSCGLDCEAQRYFGLQAGTCFQYSSTNIKESPSPLAVFVNPAENLEGDVKAIRVSATQFGQPRFSELYTFDANGSLRLLRREFSSQGSVSYKSDSGKLSGLWISRLPSSLNERLDSSASADLNFTGRTQAEHTLSVTPTAANTEQQVTPFRTFSSGIELISVEKPVSYQDAGRVFVGEVGIVRIGSFAAPTGLNGPYLLQALQQSTALACASTTL